MDEAAYYNMVVNKILIIGNVEASPVEERLTLRRIVVTPTYVTVSLSKQNRNSPIKSKLTPHTFDKMSEPAIVSWNRTSICPHQTE